MKTVLFFIQSCSFLVVLIVAVTSVSSFNPRPKDEGKKGRIINGQNALADQFPYAVYLEITLNSGLLKLCAGSLIGSQWILSAAHCFADAHSVVVYVGMSGVETAVVAYTVSMENIHLHENWECNKNDIALVKIPTTNICTGISHVPLPPLGTENSYSGDRVVISGWGETELNGDPATHLQWGIVTVMSNTHCKLFYQAITTDKICASLHGGVVASSGDSGGPMVLLHNPRLVGVMSCRKLMEGYELPAIYMRVSHFLPWIKDITGIWY